MSEYDWVKLILDFAEISEKANSDMKLRMAMLKSAARKRLEYMTKNDKKEVSDECKTNGIC